MNHFRSAPTYVLTALLALFIGSHAALVAGESTNAIDPKAVEAVQKMSDFFIGLNGLTVKATMTESMEAKERKGERSSTFTVAMQRPNQFSLVVDDKQANLNLVSDGKKTYLLIPPMHQYTVTNSPPGMDGIFDEEFASVGGGVVYAFMNLLTTGKPREMFLQEVRSGRYVGLVENGGTKLHHLSFVQDEFDWEIWIQDGEQPWPQKLALDFSKSIPGNQGVAPESRTSKMTAQLVYADWVANPKLPDTAFRFTPPEDAKPVASFRQEEKPHSSLGKAAPTFKLDTIAGGKMDLQTHKGKEVVVLDFWATWCGPCRMALPNLDEVAAEYKNKGVAFYAVNIAEDTDTVSAFLKKTGLKVPVLLDKEGKVAMQYGVEPIPHTVLIGKDGVIEVVHLGFAPDHKKRMRQELDALLAGKHLAAEKN